MRTAGEEYLSQMPAIIHKKNNISSSKDHKTHAIEQIETTSLNERDDFIYWDYERRYRELTDSQKYVVDFEDMGCPLRVEGAAGTGKTMALLMRAYRILIEYMRNSAPIKLVFFAHSHSTCTRNKELFEVIQKDLDFLSGHLPQTIRFTTLLDYCCEFTRFPIDELIEADANDAKTYGLMIIENLLNSDNIKNIINTYYPLLSPQIQEVFDINRTNLSTLCMILQHEFGVQIKGRTDYSLEKYKELNSIQNVMPNMKDRDKDLVYTIFTAYQNYLKDIGSFDIDDVTIQTLSYLNAPRWRRDRLTNGFDYIFVDEMHLFNFNEQNVFHYLTKGNEQMIPICFALDYNQAIGDYGDKEKDYIERSFISAKSKKLATIFRNSPQISEFCRSIAASGALMFDVTFGDPYNNSNQSVFTNSEEDKCFMPTLYMYDNDDMMYSSLGKHIETMVKTLQCKPNKIAIISFDPTIFKADRINKIEKNTKKKFKTLQNIEQQSDLFNKHQGESDSFIICSPYDVNGLEFDGVILFGVDEGRIPQTSGVSDVSQHFILYSSYNLLYLSASRAKYQLIILGTNTRGISSCLNHSLSTGYLRDESVQ